jgi:hypothetical protein
VYFSSKEHPVKQPQQRTLNASRGGFDRRTLPLASLSGAALLLSLGLLQNAAADPLLAEATPALQTNSAMVTGIITDPGGAASGADFAAPLVDNSTVNVSSNGAASNATGNTSLPKGALSLEINNEPEIALARARLEQTNTGEITSLLAGRALVIGSVAGASNATATVTNNTFDANATANQALTSIGVQASGAVALSAAGVRLISRQSNESPDISADNRSFIGVGLRDISKADTATVTGNTAASQAVNNNADNSIALTGASAIDTAGTKAAALILKNRQDVAGSWDAPTETGVRSDLTALTLGTVGVVTLPDAVVSGGHFTVSGNQISASAQRNLASNVIGVAEGSISAGALPLFFLSNRQKDETVGATVSATTQADVGINLTDSGVGRNLQASISGNQVSSAAGVNTARNEVFLGTADAGGAALTRVGDLAGVSGALDSTQRGASTVTAEARGFASMTGNILSGALSISNNTTQANASGNQADNTFGALVNSADALDVSVTSVQKYAGADLPVVTSIATGDAGILAGDVPASKAATTVSISGNTLASQAMVNTARNSASLDSTTTVSSSALAVDNQQTSRAAADATSFLFGFGIYSMNQLVSDDVSVSGNLASAKATQNVATNALTLKAGALSGPTTTTAAEVSDQGVVADYGVYNQQKSFESTMATVQAMPVPGLAGDNGTGIFSTAGLPARMSVTNNVLSAVARANVADNQLQASSTTGLSGASFGLSNNQLNKGDAAATAMPANIGVVNEFSDTAAPQVNVSGNQMEAAASGNAAFNALSLEAGTSLAAATSKPFTSSLSTSAGYAVLNRQSNAGAISASIELPGIGLQTSNPMPGQMTTITGNALNATAYGNHAVNSVALSALPGQLSASAALMSSQVNTGNISATVSTGFIGSNATAVSGSTTVARNQVTATAVGNMAIGSMVVGRN